MVAKKLTKEDCKKIAKLIVKGYQIKDLEKSLVFIELPSTTDINICTNQEIPSFNLKLDFK